MNEPDKMYFSYFHENLYFHENSGQTFGEFLSKITLFLKRPGGGWGVCEGGVEERGGTQLIGHKNIPEKVWGRCEQILSTSAARFPI